MPLLLLPLQILWINLIADGLLALALSAEKAEHEVMQRPPHGTNESIFSRGVGRDIFWIGLVLGVILLVLGYQYWSTNQTSWQTIVFSTLAFSRMGMALTMRSERESLFRIGLLSNKTMLWFVALTFSVQIAIIYTPVFQKLFMTTALSGEELGVSLLMSAVVFCIIELEKILKRKNKDSSL